jgi:hypothetical protein
MHNSNSSSSVIVVAIVRLIYLGIFLGEKNPDPTFDALPYLYCTQCHAIFSVIVACIPTLKPFMDRAYSGLMAVSLNQRVPGTTFGHSGEYAMQSLTKKSASGSNKGTNVSGNQLSSKAWRPDAVDHKTTITHGNGHKRDETGSINSIGSVKMVIRQTRDWNIQFDDEG